jgi:hypothetical protein
MLALLLLIEFIHISYTINYLCAVVADTWVVMNII